MNLFDVYPLYNINIVKGDGCKVWDENGIEYLDLYGGHAVISIGHAHPHYVAKMCIRDRFTVMSLLPSCTQRFMIHGSPCALPISSATARQRLVCSIQN